MTKTKLTFISDTHYFSPSLGGKGRSYELRSGSDQKCLNETGAIIDAAFEKIAKSDAQAVMIAGDLTNDGEMVCHAEFRKKLYKLKKKKQVYVISATHDWCCDQNPRKFCGEAVYHDVETMPHEKLRDFYFDFGPRQAISEFITHLGTCSYTVDIGENVRLLALNDDQNGKGRAGFKEDHFQWIEGQIKKARTDGKIMIAMEHHLIHAHTSELITGGGVCVGEREYVASRLADAGLRYIVVGHSHLQNVSSFKSERGNVITQINVGSLCGYPSPIVNVTVSEDGIEIETDCAETFIYNAMTYNTKEYLADHAKQLFRRVLECKDLSKAEFRDRLIALQLDGKKFEDLYYVAMPLLNMLDKATVRDAYRLLKPFAKADKRSVKLFENCKLTDFIYDIMLSLFDGSAQKHTEGSAYYNVVMGIVTIPEKIAPCKLTSALTCTVHTILIGDEKSISKCRIDF